MAWLKSRHLGLPLLSLVAVTAVAAAAAGAARFQLDRKLDAQRAGHAMLAAQIARWQVKPERTLVDAQEQQPRKTPQPFAVQSFIKSAQVMAAERTTVITSASTAAAAQPSNLVEVALTLQGSYSAVRSTLGDLLARHDAVVLVRLSLTRQPSTSAAAGVQARTTFLVPTTPAVAAASASAPAP